MAKGAAPTVSFSGGAGRSFSGGVGKSFGMKGAGPRGPEGAPSRSSFGVGGPKFNRIEKASGPRLTFARNTTENRFGIKNTSAENKFTVRSFSGPKLDTDSSPRLDKASFSRPAYKIESPRKLDAYAEFPAKKISIDKNNYRAARGFRRAERFEPRTKVLDARTGGSQRQISSENLNSLLKQPEYKVTPKEARPQQNADVRIVSLPDKKPTNSERQTDAPRRFAPAINLEKPAITTVEIRKATIRNQIQSEIANKRAAIKETLTTATPDRVVKKTVAPYTVEKPVASVSAKKDLHASSTWQEKMKLRLANVSAGEQMKDKKVDAIRKPFALPTRNVNALDWEAFLKKEKDKKQKERITSTITGHTITQTEAPIKLAQTAKNYFAGLQQRFGILTIEMTAPAQSAVAKPEADVQTATRLQTVPEKMTITLTKTAVKPELQTRQIIQTAEQTQVLRRTAIATQVQPEAKTQTIIDVPVVVQRQEAIANGMSGLAITDISPVLKMQEQKEQELRRSAAAQTIIFSQNQEEEKEKYVVDPAAQKARAEQITQAAYVAPRTEEGKVIGADVIEVSAKPNFDTMSAALKEQGATVDKGSTPDRSDTEVREDISQLGELSPGEVVNHSLAIINAKPAVAKNDVGKKVGERDIKRVLGQVNEPAKAA